MEGKRINEVFGPDFLQSNFWLYWRTMFAFEEWHSRREMKLYLHRFIHHVGGLPDFTALKFTKYNNTNRWHCLWNGISANSRHSSSTPRSPTSTSISPRHQDRHAFALDTSGQPGGMALSADDLVFTTIGSLVDNSDEGDHHTPAS